MVVTQAAVAISLVIRFSISCVSGRLTHYRTGLLPGKSFRAAQPGWRPRLTDLGAAAQFQVG